MWRTDVRRRNTPKVSKIAVFGEKSLKNIHKLFDENRLKSTELTERKQKSGKKLLKKL